MQKRKLFSSYALLGSAILFAQCCSYAQAEEKALKRTLREVAMATLVNKWQANLASNEIDGRLSAFQVATYAELTRAANQTNDCWEGRSQIYDIEDRKSFIQLLSHFEDAFVIPDWEAQLTEIINERYGVGATESRNNCTPDRKGSKECGAAKAYETVGGHLYWLFASCTVEAAKTVVRDQP